MLCYLLCRRKKPSSTPANASFVSVELPSADATQVAGSAQSQHADPIPPVPSAADATPSVVQGVSLIAAGAMDDANIPQATEERPHTEGITITVEGPSGASIADSGGKIIVTGVDGVAAAAGVSVGAQVISFNGIDTTTMPKASLVTLIMEAKGSKTFKFSNAVLI